MIMCSQSLNEEKERFDHLVRLINKSINEGDKEIKKLLKKITK